jgi:tetratricopeptide (TPR) repeat protein
MGSSALERGPVLEEMSQPRERSSPGHASGDADDGGQCRCSLCGQVFTPCGWSEFIGSPGAVPPSFAVPRYDKAFILVDTSGGEMWICEECYGSRLPGAFTQADMAAIHREFGLEYGERGDADKSIAAFERAASIARTPDILCGLASGHDKAGRHHEAVALLREALVLDPGHGMARWNLIGSLRDAGQLDEALARVDGQLAEEGMNPDLIMIKAGILHRMGRKGEARRCFEEAARRADCEACRRTYEKCWAEIVAKDA